MVQVNLQQGDCLKLLGGVREKSIDLILADLPYGTTRNKWDEIIPLDRLWKHYERIITDNGVIALFGDEPFASRLRLSNAKLYRYDWIWIKNRATGFLNANRMPLKNTETISVFYKHLPIYNPQMSLGKPYVTHTGSKTTNYGKFTDIETVNKGTRYPLKTIKFNVEPHTVHPTQKPTGLLNYLIKTYTDKGMTVLDNCMGSGSTGVSAVQLERNFIGMEMDQHYFGIAEHRISNAQKELTLI